MLQTFRDTYEFRHVLMALASKQLKAQYRSMSLGFLWALLNPLVMVTVLSVVWVFFFNAGMEQPSRVVVALIPYNFFSYCLSGCAVSVTSHSSLVRKVFFPRQILPFAVVLSSVVHLAVQAMLVVAVLAVFPTPGQIWGLQLLWVIPLTALLLALCVGVGLLAAAATVVFRDTQYIIQSALTVLFWLSPVVYDAGKDFGDRETGIWVQRAYFLNPVAGLLESYRVVLFHGRAPDFEVVGLALFSTLVLGAIGIRVFFVHERNFADLVR